MVHKLGETKGTPDGTFQRIDHKSDKNVDNGDRTVHTPQHFCIAVLNTGQATLANNTDNINRIKQCSKHDNKVTKALTTIQKN